MTDSGPDPSLIRHSAPAQRNRQVILEVLEANLPVSGTVLEIASGTGQHINHFAAALPQLTWQPSDPDPASRASIRALTKRTGLTNIAAPLDLDVLRVWPTIDSSAADGSADVCADVCAIISANLLHISEPQVLPALMRGAAAQLNAGALLHIYGPFLRNGKFTSVSNAEFDASLRARNARWGIRQLEDVVAAADQWGFTNVTIKDMPANNFSLLFRKG